MPDLQYDKQISLYNKVYRVFLMVLVSISFILICFGVWKVFDVGAKLDQNLLINNQIAKDTQQIIQSSQTATLEARKQNAERQERTIGYIQCVILLTKKYPDVNFPSLNYDQTKAYSDECAKTESN